VEVLIEREAELGLLGEVVDAAAGGRGGAALIEGEAGIGKTTLLGLVRDRVSASDACALYATADESETGLPLAAARVLLARAARSVSPDGPARLGLLALDGALAEPTGPGSRTEEVVHALWWLIVELADERPLVLLLDDAQWADDLTLGLLRMVARRAPQLPLALIVAARPAAPGSRHAVLAAERAFMRIEPRALSIAGTARLLEEVLGRPGSETIVARAHAATAGNPLYLFELLRQARLRGLDPLGEVLVDDRPPPQLVRLVGDRLTRLTPAARALARAVAVLGSDADAGRARALAGLHGSDAIGAEEELCAERVLDTVDYAFTHPLIAAAVREAIGTVDAAELHARAAGLLAGDGVDDQLVAEHLMRAPPRGDAAVVATLRRAGEAARRLGSLPTAVRLLKRALAEPPAPAAVHAIDFELGRALLDGGKEDGARVLTRLAQRAPEASIRFDAAGHLARRFAQDGRGSEAVAVLLATLETLDDTHRELRLDLLVELAFIATYSDLEFHDRAMRMIAVEAARVTGRTPAERLVFLAAIVLGGENVPDPAGAAHELLALRLHRDYPGGFAVGSLTLAAATLQVNADALDDAERAMDVLRSDAEELAVPYLIAVALRQQALIAYQRGDLARCELEVRGALEAGGEFAHRLTTPWLVMALAEQGRLQEAQQLLASAGMLGHLAPSVLLTAALGSRGCLRLAQGDAHRAVEDLAEARDRCAAFFRQQVEPPWQPRLVEALVLADRRQEAAEAAEAYATLAAGWGTHRALGHAARMRSLVAPRQRAIELLEEARTRFAASHARLELARTLTELGAHRRRAGERRAARAILRDAHDTAHACGATALCDRAQAELLLFFGPPRTPAGAGAGALTPAERRVAEIAAQGATNRDIARRLYLSPKTVEMHLHSTYRKLDLPGRAGLATALS
jgi:DNA-binding CsgD family transcriptional regulator/tetratricopeptide (TPR) repeat protein